MSHPVFTVGSLYQMGVSIQDIEKKKMCRTYILKKFYAMSFGPLFFFFCGWNILVYEPASHSWEEKICGTYI